MNNNTSNEDHQQEGSALSFRLSTIHFSMLQTSAIIDDVIKERGYQTITDPKDLEYFGFGRSQLNVPGLIIPLHTTDGKVGLYVYRPDNPRVLDDESKRNPDGTHPQKILKYELPSGSGVRLDCPPRSQPNLSDPKIPLWITEGQKNADSLASVGLCAVAIVGIWNFKGKNDNGGNPFMADWDGIALTKRDVKIVFGSDIMTKPRVGGALNRLIEHLQGEGANVAVVSLPNEPGIEKVDVSDFLASGHTLKSLETLIESPKSIPQPAAPLIEVLDEPPLTMHRPLAILDGQSYAAAWIPVRITKTEDVDNKGNIIKFNPPKINTTVSLIIVRGDGVVYGQGWGRSLDELGFEIKLPEKPLPDKTWSSKGIKNYLKGYRPDPKYIFDRIVRVINQFLDFDNSLADQNTMAEFLACYILATWFLDAFNVIGFLWANGERGTGKTNLLIIVAELSYLGQVVLNGGSYASLRDLADYGATLAFDDAENISDPKMDIDKRTLLLAGNRRGACVPLKEPVGSREWRTRNVNTFCPRLFSAIRIPDPVLASRSITVPLTRTNDRERANADPVDYSAWSVDRRTLIDDLWALATTHLTELKIVDEWVGKNATLKGRTLQPWRSVLAVAAWLDKNNVTGLWQKMEHLSVIYQTERSNIELSDITLLVIQAILQSAVSAIDAKRASQNGNFHFIFSAEGIEQKSNLIIDQDEWDLDHKYVTRRSVGRVMSRLRIKEVPRSNGVGSRLRSMSLQELVNLSLAYNVSLPTQLDAIYKNGIQPPISNGTNGTNGSIGSIGSTLPQSQTVTQPSFTLDGFPLAEESCDPSANTIPTLKCFACGSSNWKKHSNGLGEYCATCHPTPGSYHDK